MNRIFVKLLAVTLSLAGAAAFAQADSSELDVSNGSFSLGVGVSYRNFKRASLKGGNAIEDRYIYVPATGQVYEDGLPSGQAGQWNTVTVVDMAADGGHAHGDYGFQESLGLALSASGNILQQDALSLDLVGNFQFFSIDTASRMGMSTAANYYNALVAYGATGSANLSPESSWRPISGGPQSTAWAKTKFDAQLYVLDGGISLGYTFENGLKAFVAGGPSLTLADMETCTHSMAAGLNNSYGLSKNRNEHEFEWGLYAAVGASYNFTEQMGLSFALRYDEGFGKVGTSIAKQDLDAWGAILQLMFNF